MRSICFTFSLSALFSFISLEATTSVHSDPIASYAISANPGAVNVVTGTGALGRYLNIKPESGVRLGGLWILNGNVILAGGSGVERWTKNNLFILDLHLDMERLACWKGGEFGFEFLQYNGQNTNAGTGAVQGFNSISAAPPFHRTEFFQGWFRQSFDDWLTIRIGKTVPSYDFNNVLRAIPFSEQAHNIPTLSGLLYTPIFVNSSLLGVLPGYYDSAYGLTVNVTPNKNFYISLGGYDGNLAKGVPTGERGPQFNGYYFYIAETGLAWVIGKNQKPGKLAVGGWHQTGLLTLTDRVRQRGTQGFYAFGSQRFWYRNPGVDNSGVSGFFQYGINDSRTLEMNQYVGFGLTAFDLTRLKDSFGAGSALAWVNPNQFSRRRELMLQIYYQAFLFTSTYLEPAITYIPYPGSSSDAPVSWAATLQLTTLF